MLNLPYPVGAISVATCNNKLLNLNGSKNVC